MSAKQKFSFQVSIETEDQTGKVIAVYLQIRPGQTKTTKEYAGGNAFADYDRRGHLLGIELLAPCRAAVLDKITERGPTKKFVLNAVPRGMLVPA